MKSLLLVFISVVALSLNAATYYIDATSGNDANAGTSTGAAWQYHPGMGSFSGSYTNATGDIFVFKGGETWSEPIYIFEYTGTSESPTVLRSDASWYSGGSYTRPVLDPGGAVLSQGLSDNTTHRGNMVWVRSSDYVFVADFEVRNFVWNNPIPTSETDGFSVLFHSSDFGTASNIYAHSWLVRTADDSKFGGIGSALSSDTSAIDCIIAGPRVELDAGAAAYISDTNCSTGPAGCTSGAGTHNITTITGCDISGVTQGNFQGSFVRHNYLHDLGDSYNSGSHENGIYQTFGGNQTKYYDSNLMTNQVEGSGTYFSPGFGGQTNNTSIIYNNVFDGTYTVSLGTQEANPVGSGNKIYFLNNVVKRGATVGQIGTSKAGEPLAVFVAANNIFISGTYSSSDPATSFVTLQATIAEIADAYTNTSNLYLSVAEAEAYGMTSANNYRPSGNVGSGLDYSWLFTDDRDGTTRTNWTIGAYEFQSIGPSASGSSRRVPARSQGGGVSGVGL